MRKGRKGEEKVTGRKRKIEIWEEGKESKVLEEEKGNQERKKGRTQELFYCSWMLIKRRERKRVNTMNRVK